MIQAMWRRILDCRTLKHQEFVEKAAMRFDDPAWGRWVAERDGLRERHADLSLEEAEYVAALRVTFEKYCPPVATLPTPERARAIMQSFLDGEQAQALTA